MNHFNQNKLEKDLINLYFVENYERIRKAAQEEYFRVENKTVNDIDDLIQETALVILSLPKLLSNDKLINFAMKVACINLNKE